MYFFQENVLNKSLIAFVFLSVAFLVAVNILMPIELGQFKFTHFLFNYESEFVKRGFVGEVFRLLGFEMNYQLARIISYVLFIIFSVVFLILITFAFKDSLNRTGAWLFIFTASLHSASIQHFYVDFGRFDAFTFLISVLAIYLIAKFSKVASFIFVPVLIVLMLLIHEGSFFIYVPLILGFWFYKSDNFKDYMAIAIITLISVFSTYAISINGLITHITKDHQ